MSSPINEVKPSQVAQLMKENAELKAENEKYEDILVSIQDELLGEVFEFSFDKLTQKINKNQTEIDKLRKDKNEII